jgi:hypothetical protein
VTECLPAGWKHGSFAGATPKRCRARDRILNGGTSECHRFYAEYTSLICQTFDVVQQRISCRRSEVPSRPTSRIGRTRQSSDRLCFALLRGCGQQLLDQSLLCMRREFPRSVSIISDGARAVHETHAVHQRPRQLSLGWWGVRLRLTYSQALCAADSTMSRSATTAGARVGSSSGRPSVAHEKRQRNGIGKAARRLYLQHG